MDSGQVFWSAQNNVISSLLESYRQIAMIAPFLKITLVEFTISLFRRDIFHGFSSSGCFVLQYQSLAEFQTIFFASFLGEILYQNTSFIISLI